MNKVRCNYCMKIFDESEIVYDPNTEKESCPHCHKEGCLMDLEHADLESNTYPTPDEKVYDFSLTGDKEIYLTDDECYQYCRKISDTEYEFTQIQWCNVLSKDDNQYQVLHSYVDLTAYTLDEIENAISGSYPSLKDFQHYYGSLQLKDTLLILAELIFENEAGAKNLAISPMMSLNDCIEFQKTKMKEWSQN